MRRIPRRVGTALAAAAVIAGAGVVHSDRANASPTPRQLTMPQIISTVVSPPSAPEHRTGHRSAVLRDGDYVVTHMSQPRYWPGWGDGINEGSAYSFAYSMREGTWGEAGMQYALADSYSGLMGYGFDVPHAMLHRPYWLGEGPSPQWSSWINSRPYIGYPTMNLHYPAPREVIVVQPVEPYAATPDTTTPDTTATPGATPAPGAQQFQGPGTTTQRSGPQATAAPVDPFMPPG